MKKHIPVLLKETIEFLKPKEGDVFIDATVGLGGHAEEILKNIGESGLLLGIDRDLKALEIAKRGLDRFRKRVWLVNDDFRNIEKISRRYKLGSVDGILLDLGVSSFQLEDRERGFSFRLEGPLDMRMDRRNKLTASEVVNNYEKDELEKIFKRYGEEKFSRKIAQKIVDKRKEKKIGTTKELRNIILETLPERYKRSLKIDPATKIFQALRIEVNDEINALKEFLPQALRILKKRGRLAIISFHSLEDRIVKEFFKAEEKGCICPKEFPICRCGKKPRLKIITKKPILPSEEEIEINPRARSAKLRVAQKL